MAKPVPITAQLVKLFFFLPDCTICTQLCLDRPTRFSKTPRATSREAGRNILSHCMQV
jgi:hypothetical protein